MRESRGLLFEVYFFYVIIIIWWLTSIFKPVYLNLVSIICYHFVPLFLLYYTLYLLYTYEGTLTKGNDVRLLKSTLAMQTVQSESGVNIRSCTNSVTLSVTESGIKNEEKLQTVPESKPVKIPLCQYLCESENYEKFSQYLAQCFCLENLLFIERVCILRWYVMKLKFKKDISAISVPKSKKMYMYALQFPYLSRIHKEYSAKFVETDCDFETNKMLVWNMCRNIYTEFVNENAVNEINIPYMVRFELENAFGNEENVSVFASYDDFLNVFDESIFEIWRLLCGIYDFRFSSYLKQYS